MDAICVRCGTGKAAPWKGCRTCGFDPTGDDDALVESVYLSVGRFDDPERWEPYRKELEDVAGRIKAGGQPIFEQAELERLREQFAMVRAIPTSAVVGAVLRFFLPGVGLLALLLGIVLLLRNLRH